MNRRPIVMYLGGFARVGGIESFARDLLVGIAPEYPEREIVVWGQGGNALLDDVARSGARITRSSWRWGCAWRLPDYVLAPLGLAAVRRAAVVVCKIPPPIPVLRWMRLAARSTGRVIPFILVMPYRPLEYWGRTPDFREIGNFDVIVVQSEDGRRDLEQAGYQGRIENIPYPPPPRTGSIAFPTSREAGVIRLGYLGRLEAQKNLPYLLEVFHALTRVPGLRYELHIFGGGSQREDLERRCAELSLAGVTFHGEIPRAEISRAIDFCDLFLNTSLTEGQCLVALEVLSRGRPLVATPVGALPEVLSQAELGQLAPLGDAAAFAVAVSSVAKKIGERTITPESVVAAFRERYDYQAVLRRYLRLLTGVPSQPAAPVEMAVRAS
jgi:glycosyltransferase involved in cell wall biosynthesis